MVKGPSPDRAATARLRRKRTAQRRPVPHAISGIAGEASALRCPRAAWHEDNVGFHNRRVYCFSLWGPKGYSGARHTAPAATAEPRAMTKYPATQPDGLAAPPNQSSTFPTATGPRKPVVNPASAYKASAAPRCAGSAAATAPPASAPTSAKLVI